MLKQGWQKKKINFTYLQQCRNAESAPVPAIMPQRRAGVTAHIKNFGHETRPSKKARTSQNADKENASSQLLSRLWDKSSKSGQYRQPLLVNANGPNVTRQVPRPYIEEVKDENNAPNIDPLPFDLDGPIMDPSWSQSCCLFLGVLWTVVRMK